MKIKQSELKQIIQEELQKIKEGKESLVVDNNGNVYGGIRNLFQEAAGDGIPAPGAQSMFMIKGSDDDVIDTLMRAYMIMGYDPKGMFERYADASTILDLYDESPEIFKEKVDELVQSLDPKTREKVENNEFVDKLYKIIDSFKTGGTKHK